MTDRDDIRQPADHLPPASERENDEAPAQPTYPDVSPTEDGGVSPATAAEPREPNRHGLDGMTSGPR